jgi:hypothetical protein
MQRSEEHPQRPQKGLQNPRPKTQKTLRRKVSTKSQFPESEPPCSLFNKVHESPHADLNHGISYLVIKNNVILILSMLTFPQSVLERKQEAAPKVAKNGVFCARRLCSSFPE